MTSTVEKTKEFVVEELPSNPFAFEILQLASKQKIKANKVKVLQKYEHESLKSIFIWNFDDSIVSMIPQGEVPYPSMGEDLVKSGSVSDLIEREVEKMNVYNSNSVSYTEKIRTGHTTIRSEYTKLINFVQSTAGVPGNPNLTTLRRENMFIQMVQGLHPLEAEIMCLVKDKKLQTKYKISKEVVAEAYPDIVWGNR